MTKTLRLTAHRTVGAFAALALLLLTMTVLGSSQAHAQTVGPCTNVKAFKLDVTSGNDDLRYNSEVDVFLHVAPTPANPFGLLALQPIYGPVASWQTGERTVSLANANWTVNSCTITGVTVHVISHNNWFETTDNWDMRGFAIYGYGASGSYAYWQTAYDPNVIFRFSGSQQYWSLAA